MTQWKEISTAPKGQWVLVCIGADFPDEGHGPWETGYKDKFPGPKIVSAINIPNEGWGAYSADGCDFCWIAEPVKWMELPE